MKRMKCSYLPDDLIYEALAKQTWPDGRPAPLMLWETGFPGFPAKVVSAKLRLMIAKGRLRGCPCGCRGDFRFPWEDFGDCQDRSNWRERLKEYLASGKRVYGY